MSEREKTWISICRTEVFYRLYIGFSSFQNGWIRGRKIKQARSEVTKKMLLVNSLNRGKGTWYKMEKGETRDMVLREGERSGAQPWSQKVSLGYTLCRHSGSNSRGRPRIQLCLSQSLTPPLQDWKGTSPLTARALLPLRHFTDRESSEGKLMLWQCLFNQDPVTGFSFPSHWPGGRGACPKDTGLPSTPTLADHLAVCSGVFTATRRGTDHQIPRIKELP